MYVIIRPIYNLMFWSGLVFGLIGSGYGSFVGFNNAQSKIARYWDKYDKTITNVCMEYINSISNKTVIFGISAFVFGFFLPITLPISIYYIYKL
jgi:hypothetical protein